MALRMDPRRAAMLEEMGVGAWQPRGQAESGTPSQEVVSGPAEAEHDRASRDVVPEPLAARAAASGAAGAAPPRDRGAVADMDWPELRESVSECRACGLCKGRRQTVFGVGDERADWMVVGEAPGENEDRQGEPFVGVAGQLLDQMLASIGLDRAASRDDAHPRLPGVSRAVYIANAVKCRPPNNRNPQPDEVALCLPYLRRQVALVRPRVILAMGRFAVQALLDTQAPIGRLRGQVHRIQSVPTVVTYHPAYLLRQLPDKAKAWDDLCLAANLMRDATASS